MGEGRLSSIPPRKPRDGAIIFGDLLDVMRIECANARRMAGMSEARIQG
jgi:hypothetical protein